MDPILQDPLDQEIAAKKASIATKERDLEMERIELRALQRAASLRPFHRKNGVSRLEHPAADAGGHAPRERSRGKLRGTLSNRWREIMRRVVMEGNEPLPPDLWSVVAHQAGFDLEVKSARDWLRRGVGAQLGFIDRQGDAYRVSQAAIEKFNLKAATPPSEVPEDGVA
jgi:hypothetical protein